MIGSSRMDSLFIGLELCDFCVFNDGIVVYNDCFEMKYELECGYCNDMLLSIKIDAAIAIPASTANFHTFRIKLCQISRIGCNSFGVTSPTTITAAISIKNENEMKYEGNLLTPQAQTQSQHDTPHLAEQSFNFDLTGAAPGELGDLEYIFCVFLCEDCSCCHESFNGNYESAGMSVFLIVILRAINTPFCMNWFCFCF